MKTYENEINKLSNETQAKLSVAISPENWSGKQNTKIGKLQHEVVLGLYHLKHYPSKVTVEDTEAKIRYSLDEVVYLIEQKEKANNTLNGKLVVMLKEQTQSLKTQFVNKCVAYAYNEFDTLNEKETAMRAIYRKYIDASEGVYGKEEEDMIISDFSLEVIAEGYVDADWEEEFSADRHYMRKTFSSYYSKKHKMYRPDSAFSYFINLWREVKNSKALKGSKGEWGAQAEKNALSHYENSILKLALRIEQKELNQDKLEMVTSHIDVNISTTITDGDKSVKAWTIIAEGPIQRPHYRYLVK